MRHVARMSLRLQSWPALPTGVPDVRNLCVDLALRLPVAHGQMAWVDGSCCPPCLKRLPSSFESISHTQTLPLQCSCGPGSFHTIC